MDESMGRRERVVAPPFVRGRRLRITPESEFHVLRVAAPARVYASNSRGFLIGENLPRTDSEPRQVPRVPGF